AEEEGDAAEHLLLDEPWSTRELFPDSFGLRLRIRHRFLRGLVSSSNLARTRDSIRDRGHLPHELVARQLADHEVGDIRPRDAIAASRDALDDDTTSAGPRSIREDHRSHCDPVEIPCSEFFEHGTVLPIHSG